jgi:hypothetical protein
MTLRDLLILQMMMQQQQEQQQPSRSGGVNPMRLLESLGGGGTGGAAASQVGAGASGAGAGAVTVGSGGVATIPAGASVPAGYTAVGTAANGGVMVAPTSMAGTGATTAGTSTLGSVGAYALPVAAVVAALSNAWETGGKDILRGRGDRADWTNQGANMILGAAPNIGLRLLGKRSIGAMMKSGKSGAQQIRDDFRGDLKKLGIADDGYNITLADGSKYNIGLDGGARLKNVGKNIDGKTERQTWDVDWSNPLAKFTTDKIEPLIRSTYGADDVEKGYRPGQFTGMLVNAAMSNAKNEQEIERNIQSILSKFQTGEAQPGQPQQQQQQVQRPGRGQVARVSPGMYMNDRGQVARATTSQQAMQQNYGNRIPRGGRR